MCSLTYCWISLKPETLISWLRLKNWVLKTRPLVSYLLQNFIKTWDTHILTEVEKLSSKNMSIGVIIFWLFSYIFIMLGVVQWCNMALLIWVNIGSGNDLLPDGTVPLPGGGVTKPIFSVPLLSLFFRMIKTAVTCMIWSSYLAGVTAAALRRHLTNMNMIESIWPILLLNQNFP